MNVLEEGRLIGREPEEGIRAHVKDWACLKRLVPTGDSLNMSSKRYCRECRSLAQTIVRAKSHNHSITCLVMGNGFTPQTVPSSVESASRSTMPNKSPSMITGCSIKLFRSDASSPGTNLNVNAMLKSVIRKAIRTTQSVEFNLSSTIAAQISFTNTLASPIASASLCGSLAGGEPATKFRWNPSEPRSSPFSLLSTLSLDFAFTANPRYVDLLRRVGLPRSPPMPWS